MPLDACSHLRDRDTIGLVGYEPIRDLTSKLRERESELTSLAAAWGERRQELGQSELQELHERIRRRWAIDTGMIEGLYSIARGTTELLIDRGLHADLISHGEADRPATEIIGFLHDQAEVYDWLFEFVAEQRQLSKSFIKELHQLLTRHQESTDAVDGLGRIVEVPLAKGEWKRLPNNPQRPDETLHEYCPPEHVDAEMDRLVTWHLEHQGDAVAPEVEAAWLHHRFTQIHPFQDGNGRVARALATLVLIRADMFPMSISPEEKATYIDALEAADAGELTPLVELLISQERRDFGRALGITEQIADERLLFTAALEKAKEAKGERIAAYGDVKEIAAAVLDAAISDLERRRNEFNKRLRSEDLHDAYHAHVYRPRDDHSRGWYHAQIVECAGQLDYFANVREYRDWVRLSISDEHEDRATVLIISLHAFGRTFKGVMTALAFVEAVEHAEDGARRARGPWLAADEPFTFGYLDQREHVLPRFRDWLHTAWLSELKTWEDSL
jgi:Fic family protein